MVEVTAARPVQVISSDRPQARSSRTTGFAALLATHWDRAYRFAHYLTGNVADADDLIQQAAEEAFLAFERFRPGTRFDRWLFRILHHSFIDRVRRERHRRFVPLEEAVMAAAATDGINPDGASREGLDGPVRAALLALPVEFRAAIVLVDLEGMAYDEVARVLRLPIGTVRSRLHRARLILRRELQPYVDAVKHGEW